MGFLPDADGFAHYAETRFGTLCRHYAGGLCALYAGLCRKFLKRRAWRADLLTCTTSGNDSYEIPLILSHHGLGNEIDDRIESRPGEIALKWEMRSVESRNEIDRVALQMGNETIESRSVEIAPGNGK